MQLATLPLHLAFLWISSLLGRTPNLPLSSKEKTQKGSLREKDLHKNLSFVPVAPRLLFTWTCSSSCNSEASILLSVKEHSTRAISGLPQVSMHTARDNFCQSSRTCYANVDSSEPLIHSCFHMPDQSSFLFHLTLYRGAFLNLCSPFSHSPSYFLSVNWKVYNLSFVQKHAASNLSLFTSI